jgi:hypothetical protein
MAENCETTTTGIPGEQPGAPNPSQAGVDKESKPDPRIPQAPVPKPAGVTMEIKVWAHGVTSSPQNSLTDQEAEDEPAWSVPRRVFEEFGSGGLDKLNFEVSCNLENLKEKANIAYYVFWDRARNPAPITYGQMDLPAGSHPVVRERVEYMPDKPFKRYTGEHEVEIYIQLRTNMQTGAMAGGTAAAWTEEFPHVGEGVSRKVKVTILD